VSQLGKRGKVGEDNRGLDDPPLFNMSATAVAQIRVARAALYSEGSKNGADGSGQESTADAALRGKVGICRAGHGIESSRRGATLSTAARGSSDTGFPHGLFSFFLRLNGNQFARSDYFLSGE
jgi:hypothetical protein